MLRRCAGGIPGGPSVCLRLTPPSPGATLRKSRRLPPGRGWGRVRRDALSRLNCMDARMTTNRGTLTGAVFLGALLVSGVAAAQGAGEGMAGAEMVDEAGVLLTEMAETVEVTQEAEDDARSSGDVPQLRCVSSKLATMNGFVRVAEEHFEDLTLTAGSDSAGAQHHFGIISTSHTRVVNLGREAAQCSGDVLRYTGANRRRSSVDSRIPTTDTTGTSETGSAGTGTSDEFLLGAGTSQSEATPLF